MSPKKGPVRLSDRVYKSLSALLGGSAFLFLFLVIAVLLIYSYPSFIVNGVNFFTSVKWDPAISSTVVSVAGVKAMEGASYGMLVFFIGTLLSSGLALLIGAPLSLGVAIFLSEFAPARVSTVASFFVELLAGIPSIVFGFWGFIVLGPYLLKNVEPSISRFLGFIPFLGGHVYSYGLPTSGIVLALMIVPIIASISRDAMSQAPTDLREAGQALGMTKWEITRKVVLPYAKTAIVGSIVLGLGRALGETMAVAMVSQSAVNIVPKSLYYPINSIAAFMAQTLDSAFTDPTSMEVYALVELAVVLFAITTIINVLARLLVRQGFITSAEHVVQV